MQAELPASARPIIDTDERRVFFAEFLGKLDRAEELDEWIARSPLVEVTLGETKDG